MQQAMRRGNSGAPVEDFCSPARQGDVKGDSTASRPHASDTRTLFFLGIFPLGATPVNCTSTLSTGSLSVRANAVAYERFRQPCTASDILQAEF